MNEEEKDAVFELLEQRRRLLLILLLQDHFDSSSNQRHHPYRRKKPRIYSPFPISAFYVEYYPRKHKDVARLTAPESETLFKLLDRQLDVYQYKFEPWVRWYDPNLLHHNQDLRGD